MTLYEARKELLKAEEMVFMMRKENSPVGVEVWSKTRRRAFKEWIAAVRQYNNDAPWRKDSK
jgi:hypothetical protein